MKNYVLGFLFNNDFTQVMVIRKNKPQWQAGRMNGLGGHVEPQEPLAIAMRREFREESGQDVEGWSTFGRLHGADWQVFLYWAIKPEAMVCNVCDEGTVLPVFVDELHKHPVLPNLHYLIPMAINHATRQDSCPYFDIRESE